MRLSFIVTGPDGGYRFQALQPRSYRLTAALDGFVHGQRNRSRRGVAVDFNIAEQLLLRQLQSHGNHLADAQIGLVGNEEGQVVNRVTAGLECLPDGLAEARDRVLEDVAALHARKDPRFLAGDHLLRQAGPQARGRTLEPQLLGKLALGVQVGCENPACRIVLRTQDGGPGGALFAAPALARLAQANWGNALDASRLAQLVAWAGTGPGEREGADREGLTPRSRPNGAEISR